MFMEVALIIYSLSLLLLVLIGHKIDLSVGIMGILIIGFNIVFYIIQPISIFILAFVSLIGIFAMLRGF